MELFLLLLPFSLLLVFTLVATVVEGGKLNGRSQELRRAWSSGLTAQARCLRAYMKPDARSAGRMMLHHVYEFRSGDGRVIRFEEAQGPSTRVEGDMVTVYYAADCPERATTHPPGPVKNAVGSVRTLVALTFLTVMIFCLLVLTATAFVSVT